MWVACLVPVLLCSGLIALSINLETERQRETAAIKSMVLVELRRHGIASLSEDTEVVRNRNHAHLHGMGRTADGQMRRVSVIFTVGDFGGTSKWRIDDLFIDGESIH